MVENHLNSLGERRRKVSRGRKWGLRAWGSEKNSSLLKCPRGKLGLIFSDLLVVWVFLLKRKV